MGDARCFSESEVKISSSVSMSMRWGGEVPVSAWDENLKGIRRILQALQNFQNAV